MVYFVDCLERYCVLKTKKRKQKTLKENNFWKIFYTTTLCIGGILMAFEIMIYRRTIIELYIPILIILIVGFITFLFNKEHYKNVYSLKGNFNPLFQNIISWGFIFCYIFMATNYFFAENKITKYQFKIIEKETRYRRKSSSKQQQHFVTINYFNFKKELVFFSKDTYKVNKADSVILLVKKGRLGFDILEEYDVFH